MSVRGLAVGGPRIAGLLALAVVLGGCATTVSEQALEVSLNLDSPSYQTGEPVEATVKVKNMTDADLLLPSLDDRTLGFYLGQPGTGVRTVRRPVTAKDLQPAPRRVPPGGTTQRTFLFASLTSRPGQWGLLAVLREFYSEGSGNALAPSHYSNMAQFEVGQAVKFRRDPYSGLITKEQALELVRSHAGLGQDAQLKAVLMPLGESGLCVWSVFLAVKQASAEGPFGFEVNPYSGLVRPLPAGQVPWQKGEEP